MQAAGFTHGCRVLMCTPMGTHVFGVSGQATCVLTVKEVEGKNCLTGPKGRPEHGHQAVKPEQINSLWALTAVSLFPMIPFTSAKFVLVSRALWEGHNPNAGSELLQCSDLTHLLSLPAFLSPLTQPIKEKHPLSGGAKSQHSDNCPRGHCPPGKRLCAAPL